MLKVNERTPGAGLRLVTKPSARTKPRKRAMAKSFWMFWLSVVLHALFLIVALIVLLRSS